MKIKLKLVNRKTGKKKRFFKDGSKNTRKQANRLRRTSCRGKNSIKERSAKRMRQGLWSKMANYTLDHGQLRMIP